MSAFDDAFDMVIRHEGGYVWDENDPGGETKFGISKRSYPDEDIAGLTLMRARELYRRDYWDKIQGDQLPAWISVHVFDAAVNSGVSRAAKWLQSAVGTTTDGAIGAKTISAARAADPGATVARFTGHRLRFMSDLPTWQHFGKGWARRLAANLMDVGNG